MDFQIETWQAYQEGCSGIVHASTGMGKTYAIWPCALLPYLEAEHNDDPQSQPLRVLWLTPLRALANDLALAMPEVTARLDSRLTDYLNDVGAQMPTVNPNYDPDSPQVPNERRGGGGRRGTGQQGGDDRGERGGQGRQRERGTDNEQRSRQQQGPGGGGRGQSQLSPIDPVGGTP